MTPPKKMTLSKNMTPPDNTTPPNNMLPLISGVRLNFFKQKCVKKNFARKFFVANRILNKNHTTGGRRKPS